MHLSLYLALSFGSVQVLSAPCTICKGGEDISLPEKEITIPGYEFLETCNDLNTVIPGALQLGSEDCDGVQSIGSLCGCSVSEDACRICTDGSPVGMPSREIPLFQSLFPQGITPTCDLFEAFLLSMNQEDALCVSTQSFMGSYCGCPGAIPLENGTETCSLCPGGEIVSEPDKVINLFEFETCADFDDALRLLLPAEAEQCSQIQSIYGLCGCSSGPDPPCSMCQDGSQITTPDRVIPFVESPFGPGFNITCALYEANVLTLAGDDQACQLAQGLGSYCGCPPLENHCEFCPGEKVHPDNYAVEIGALEPVREAGVTPTCEFTETLLLQVPSDDKLQCFGLQQKAFLCGCNDGHATYMNAYTENQRNAIAYIPKATSFLSIICTLLVISDILRSKAKRQRVYGRLVVIAAVYDFVYAIAWFIGTWAVPVYDEYGDPTGVVGASGTAATCTGQAFFVEIGQTTLLLNISLSIYFLLVINYGWKERRLQAIQIYLLGIPIVLGLALAFGGLPVYSWLPIVCQVQYFPLEDNLAAVILLILIPVGVSILALTVIMVLIYRGFYRIRHHEKYGSKHRCLATIVFWQSFFYLVAFLVSWPVVMTGVLKGGMDGNLSYAFSFTLAFVAPIQGAVNSVVYFHTRVYSRHEGVLVNKVASAVAGDEDEPNENQNTTLPETALSGSEETGTVGDTIHCDPQEISETESCVGELLDPAFMIAFEEAEDSMYTLEPKPKGSYWFFQRRR